MVGFDVGAPFFYNGKSVFFDFRVRASLHLLTSTQRPGGFDAIGSAFHWDMQPQTSSATTSVRSAINVAGQSSLSTIDMYNVTSDRVYISPVTDQSSEVKLDKSDRELVLGLAIGLPAAAAALMIGVGFFTWKSAAVAKAVTSNASESVALLSSVASRNV